MFNSFYSCLLFNLKNFDWYFVCQIDKFAVYMMRHSARFDTNMKKTSCSLKTQLSNIWRTANMSFWSFCKLCSECCLIFALYYIGSGDPQKDGGNHIERHWRQRFERSCKQIAPWFHCQGHWKVLPRNLSLAWCIYP